MARRLGTIEVIARCCAVLLCVVFAERGAMAQATGGCCDVNGNCVGTTQCACTLGGGGWQGTGSGCNTGALCTTIAGACCTNSGCTYVVQSLCASLSGTFLANQICNVAICPPQPTGACCCQGSFCVDTDVDLCTLMGGNFVSGSTCLVTNPCGGACCGPATGQCTITLQSACVSPQVWLGTPTCTPTNPCIPNGFVACCFNGTCTYGSYCDCVFKNGYPVLPPQTCTANICASAIPGACCTSNGICVQASQPTCVNYLGGSFVPGGTCPIAACPNNLGTACCCMGACKFTDPVMCQLAQGTVLPAGTTCANNPCQGACCNSSTGACVAGVSASQCPAATGTFYPGLTSCLPNPCTGACCDPATGNCFQAVATQCSVPPNIFFGVGTVCSPNICHPPSGACCDTITGVCTIVTTNGCPTPTQIYMGANTTCSPNPCVVCCNPQTGVCSQIPAGSASCPSNTVQYPGLSCVPNTCPPQTGACCFGGTTGTPAGCVTGLTQAQCQAPNFWLGVGSTCTPNKCPGACCNPQTGICVYTGASACPFPVPPPFLYLVSCTPNNPCPQPPPTGACCNLATGACSILNANACPTTTSIFLGVNSTCTPNPCVRCCDPSTGNCTAILPGTNACIAPLTTVVGISCTPNNPCPPPTPSGACCSPQGICTVGLASACVSPSVYLGNGTTCGITTCLLCCNPITGTCYPASGIFGFPTCKGFTTGGGILTAGTSCTPNPCPPPGACCKSTGQCVQSTQAACNGTWLGAGTTCQANTCYRCCLNGQCYTPFLFWGSAYCIGGPGASVAIASSCTPNPCPIPVGACCTGTKYGCQPTGNICNLVTQAQCAQLQGQWQGANVPSQSPPGNFTACCKANFNGTGGVTVQDFFSFLSAWFVQLGMSGPNPPLTADFNCNGIVTTQDLFDFLTAWFAKCF